jgi:hypothetical protein
MHGIQLLLTKFFYIRLFNRTYKGIVKSKLFNGNDIEIILFSNRNLINATATFFGTIIMEESVFKGNNKFNYILTHEYAHTKQKLSLVFLIVVSLVLIRILLLNYRQNITLAFISFLFLLFFIFLWSWIIEIDADYYAIKHIGKNPFLIAKYDEIQKTQQTKFFDKLTIRLTRPPYWVPIKIYEFINNKFER